MVAGFVKVGSLAALALVGYDLGRPVVTRYQLESAAQEAADSAGRRLETADSAAVQEAAAEARAVADDKGATLVSFEVDEEGRAVVRLARHVEPVAFDAVDALRSWYDVEVDASSVGTLAGPRR